MKQIIAGLTLITCLSFARAELITVKVDNVMRTNSVTVGPDEQLFFKSGLCHSDGVPTPSEEILIDGKRLPACGLTLYGPLTYRLKWQEGFVPGPEDLAIRTLEVVPIAPAPFPVGRTVVVSDTNAVMISLEVSTDLVYWQAATNGIYDGSPAAKFFRIKVERLASE